MIERTGIVTFGDKPLTLIGGELRVGDPVPDFTLTGGNLLPVTRDDLAGKTTLYNIVPSLDTSVCSMQTRRFNQELEKLPELTQVVTVSADLPFAQLRYREAEKITHAILSDHREFSFAAAFGLGIKELRLLARAVYVVDPEGKVVYREIVPDLSRQPDYEAVLAAMKP